MDSARSTSFEMVIIMELPKIMMPEKRLSRFDDIITTEWLITNSAGGYSASTVLGLNTRKYHGLLVAALDPPGNRTVCLAKLDEDVIVGDRVFRLGANEFHDTIFPQGYTFLKDFSASPFPKFTYEFDKMTIQKTVFMPCRKNVVTIFYNFLNKTDKQVKTRFFPLVSNRYFHAVVDHSRRPLSFQQQLNGLKVKLAFTNPKVTIITNATSGKFVEKPNWVKRLHYREETKRGESDTDDGYQPGYYELSLEPNIETKFAFISAASESGEQAEEMLSLTGSSLIDLEQTLTTELECRSFFLDKFFRSHTKVPVTDWLRWVLLATDSFLVKNSKDLESIIAGYFWFESWGRDTFISLPGLLLVTERFEEAKKVLLKFSSYIKDGLVPNLVPDKSGVPAYNTVDGTLWYVNAVLQYLKYTGDFDFVQQELWKKLKSIIEKHEKGTANDIRLESDCLVSHGPQLTWMDATVDGKAVTPRAGKAVEIQALWYNALKTMQLVASRFKEIDLAEKYAGISEKTKKSFEAIFWNEEKKCLFDVVEASGVDGSFRPNQIIAAALDFRMLGNDKNKQIVEFVQREFLAPYGLRTLSKSDPRYQGTYEGYKNIRDQAYHNGTVWPWLIGPFTTAFLRAKGISNRNRDYAFKTFIKPLFEKHIYEAGLGSVSEIFDGDPPYKPKGCIAQAWSVAEPLRVYVEEILRVRPTHERDVLQG